MGLESYLLEVCFKNPVPQTDIKDIIESAGASFLAGKSNTEPIDTYRNFYFEIRSDLGLTELYILLAPEKRVVTNFSLRFSILSPSSVIDQSFAFLNKLNTIRSIKVIDADNKLKELDLSADQFKLNKNTVRKRQIIINNKTGLVIEGGAVTTEYIHNNNLMEKIWGQNITKTSPASNKMTKALKRLLAVILIFFLIIYFGIYYITPPFLVKNEIQNFLDKEYNKKFKVVKIKTEYSPDLFHQPTGYCLVLKDSDGLEFDNVYVQNNKAQGKWITYMGTDILQGYEEAKAKSGLPK